MTITNIVDHSNDYVIGGGKRYVTHLGHRYLVRKEGRSEYIQSDRLGKVRLSSVKTTLKATLKK